MHDPVAPPPEPPATPSEPLQVDLADEAVYWDLTQAQSYGGYLDLGRLLNAQHPRSPDHEEMLFIIVHY